jgi:hypothetical protein
MRCHGTLSRKAREDRSLRDVWEIISTMFPLNPAPAGAIKAARAKELARRRQILINIINDMTKPWTIPSQAPILNYSA